MIEDAKTSAFLQLRRKLKATAQGLLLNREDAEDALQELFIRVWQRGNEDSSTEQKRAFLFTSLRNICIDMLRKRSKSAATDGAEVADRLVCHGGIGGVEGNDAIGEFRKSVRRRLNGVVLNVFELYSFEQLDYSEIAERLGITVEASRSYMCRARKVMKDECDRLLK
jgi:RNA polymerase sigma-70 factor (ECF subfamily)